MKFLKHGFKSAARVILIGAFLMLFLLSTAFSQNVPISFDEYHGYTKTVKYLQDVARAYPNITDLVEIGKSNMGRSIYVLIISKMDNGTTIDAHIELRNPRKEGVKNVIPMKSYQGKPGHWIDGGTHGNEYTGSEVCLYTIDKLVTGYGRDQQLTGLIDKNTFYICPMVNPDGVFNSVEGGSAQRGNSMMVDNDRDGKINEDGPDDLNGDGMFMQFRYKDENGRYVIDDVDPRLMVQLGRDETTTKPRYSVIVEDKDNDGDGRRGEDNESGIDVNRNYPEGWFNDEGFKGGSGTYAASSPEAKAILEYFTNNTNILMVQSFHTSGGFTYRPYARWPDSRISPRDLAVLDKVMGAKYLELHGEELPASWRVQGQAPAAGRGAQAGVRRATPTTRPATAEVQVRATGGSEQPRLWRPPYNMAQDRAYGYGIFMDWAYGQFGAYSMSTELWNSTRDMKGIPEFTGDDANLQRQRALLKYVDDNFDGKFYADWKSFNHPDLGSGELGGWIQPYNSRNNAFPGESLIGVCDIHYQFEIFKADLLPEVVISNALARTLYTTNSSNGATAKKEGDQVVISKADSKGRYKVIEVTATIENTGKLATHLERGARLAGNRNDAVWLVGDREKITFLQGSAFQQIGVLDGTMPIPGVSTQGAGQRGQRGQQRTQMPANLPPDVMQQMMQRGGRGGAQAAGGANNRREVRWLIAVEGDTPLKVIVTSQKGGTKVQELTIR
ncbi:M14 family metallopeptidase [candidate division KSB1 bacterium]